MESNLQKIQKMMKDKNSDLKLGEDKPGSPTDKKMKEKKRVHKKPIALKDLENKDRLLSLKKKQLPGTTSEEVKTKDMRNILDNETNTIFNKPWNKLEKGLKCNRINHYLITQEEYTFVNNDQEEVKKMLYAAINKGILTKNTDVNYSKDDGKIVKINVLLYDEQKKKFSIKQEPVKKQKSTCKSKTNAQRLFKR